MQSIDLVSKKRPQIKIILESGEVTLTRKRVPARLAKEYTEQVEGLGKLRESGEIDDIEYTFRVIENMVDGFEREKFEDIDMYDLKDIAEAIGAMGNDSIEQKKSE
jgi:uncharacterized protein YxjI